MGKRGLKGIEVRGVDEVGNDGREEVSGNRGEKEEGEKEWKG